MWMVPRMAEQMRKVGSFTALGDDRKAYAIDILMSPSGEMQLITTTGLTVLRKGGRQYEIVETGLKLRSRDPMAP